MGSAIHNNNILYTYIQLVVYTTPTAPAFILLLLPLYYYTEIYTTGCLSPVTSVIARAI